MNWLCKFFGHKLETQYHSKKLFFTITKPYHDGIDRAHRELFCKCERCNKKIHIGKTIDPLT